MSNATFRAEYREPVTYVALPITVTMHDIGARIGDAHEQLDRYLASRGINPAGPSLVRYRVLDQNRPFLVDVGWVIPENTWIDLPYVADVLPGGRYAVGSFSGPYARLPEVTAETMMWADLEGLEFEVTPNAGEGASARRGEPSQEWASRVEVYVDEPVVGAAGLEGPVEVCILTRT